MVCYEVEGAMTPGKPYSATKAQIEWAKDNCPSAIIGEAKTIHHGAFDIVTPSTLTLNDDKDIMWFYLKWKF